MFDRWANIKHYRRYSNNNISKNMEFGNYSSNIFDFSVGAIVVFQICDILHKIQLSGYVIFNEKHKNSVLSKIAYYN